MKGASLVVGFCLIICALAVNLPRVLGCSLGSRGTVECVKSPRYKDSQWSTCLADKDIKDLSFYRYTCPLFRFNCPYLCMQETYDIPEGKVDAVCKCSPDHSLRSARSADSTELDETCYLPTGDDCNWYRTCLERYQPCGPEGYALTYALKYCNLYNKNRHLFSKEGKLWVDKTRGCLQKKLVPLMRPWRVPKPTCSDIQKWAFDSHIPCYVDPFPGISICSLGLSDWIKVGWTIKSAFVEQFRESIVGIKEVLVHCSMDKVREIQDKVNRIAELLDESVDTVIMKIDQTWDKFQEILDSKRKKREVNDGDPYQQYAQLIGEDIDEDSNWDDKQVDWIALTNGVERDDLTDTVTISIQMYLFPEVISDLTLNTTLPTTIPDVSHFVDQLLEDIKHGRLEVDIDGEVQNVTSIRVCPDLECTQLGEGPVSGAERLRTTHYVPLLILTLLTCIICQNTVNTNLDK